MTAAVLLGLVCAAGALLAWRALAPPPPPLDLALRRFSRADLAPVALGDQSGGRSLSDVLGRGAARLGGTSSLVPPSIETDLLLVGRSPERHLGTKVLLALFGLLLPSATAALLVLADAGIGFGMPVAAGLALGVAFFFVPDLSVRSEAEERRRGFRHALGSFLDLVVIGLAGGAGVESALRDAASIGEGWAYGQLRHALDVTVLTGETPWAALARLGAELGVPELGELAASVSLAGTEGARVRDSLAAKATSLRDHALATAEAEAQAATERMALPVVLLFVGFLLLIGYPAVDAVLTGI